METRRTKAPNKSSLTIPVGDFFISTLRTHSLLTMNKTKKRACKRANRGNTVKNFWKGFYTLNSRIAKVRYVRASMGLCLSEALKFVDRHQLEPQRPTWNDAPLVPDPDDILF